MNKKIYIPNFNTFADIVDRLAVTTNKLAFFENKKREESLKENPDKSLIVEYDRLSRNECEFRNLLKREMDKILSEIVETQSYNTLSDNRTFSQPTKSIPDLIEEICYQHAKHVKEELATEMKAFFEKNN
jgi:hypothetical protein